jgi:hypothetical protein
MDPKFVACSIILRWRSVLAALRLRSDLSSEVSTS